MENPKTENIKELTTARLDPVIKSFFENMTDEHWRSIKAGKPDIAAKTLLAEAIIEIIEIASKHFQTIAQNANFEVSEVLDNMGNILPEPLAEALKADRRGHEDSTENFEQLFAKEVLLSVQSAQSDDSQTSSILGNQHIIPPNRLNKMIHFGGRMIKAFISMMKSVGMSTDTVSLTDSEVDTDILDSQDVPEEQLDEVITPASFKSKLGQPLKNTSAKIKAFFAKQFAKATILRAVKSIRATFHSTGNDESSESVEQLVDDFLLQTVKDLSDNETCELELFKSISMGKSVEFIIQLTDMLDHHASPGMAPETLPDHFRSAYVDRKVRVFLGLMRWWFFTQAESPSQSVMRALLGTASVTELQTSVPTSQPKPDHTVLDASARK
ncbi:hypothetical protein Ciccas_013832, partial [Cichlidogyrus casuarinus]